jgi:hypothetical protein
MLFACVQEHKSTIRKLMKIFLRLAREWVCWCIKPADYPRLNMANVFGGALQVPENKHSGKLFGVRKSPARLFVLNPLAKQPGAHLKALRRKGKKLLIRGVSLVRHPLFHNSNPLRRNEAESLAKYCLI